MRVRVHTRTHTRTHTHTHTHNYTHTQSQLHTHTVTITHTQLHTHKERESTANGCVDRRTDTQTDSVYLPTSLLVCLGPCPTPSVFLYTVYFSV